MGMPKIPDGKNRPNKQQVVIDLLESVALEEMAAAHLLNAEGEKMQAMVEKYTCNQLDYCEMQQGWASAQRMINSVIMNQWLLINKLSLIPEINEPYCTQKETHCRGGSGCCDSPFSGECNRACEKCKVKDVPKCCNQTELEKPSCQDICECEHAKHSASNSHHAIPEERSSRSRHYNDDYAQWCKDCSLWETCTNPNKCPER